MKNLTITVITPGDRSVGIPDYSFDVVFETDDTLETEYRKGIREAASNLGEAITGEKSHAIFSDECCECGKILDHHGECVNCPANQ